MRILAFHLLLWLTVWFPAQPSAHPSAWNLVKNDARSGAKGTFLPSRFRWLKGENVGRRSIRSSAKKPSATAAFVEPARYSTGKDAIDLSYCELIKDAEHLAGKEVRVTGIWRFGFEQTALTGKECPNQPQAWLELAEEGELCPGSRKKWNSPGSNDTAAEITAVGRLRGPGRYGHLGDYSFQFVVTCLEKIQVIASQER